MIGGVHSWNSAATGPGSTTRTGALHNPEQANQGAEPSTSVASTRSLPPRHGPRTDRIHPQAGRWPLATSLRMNEGPVSNSSAQLIAENVFQILYEKWCFSEIVPRIEE
jgi:hypothetical protein